MSSANINTTIGERGQIVIPAKLRKELHLTKGDIVTLSLESGGIKIVPKLHALRAAQALIKKHIPADVDLVAELLDERRQDAVREAQKMKDDDERN